MTLTFRDFVRPLVWLDGRPLACVIEPYRWVIFDAVFGEDSRINLVLSGRSKKNWKTADLVIGGVHCLVADSPAGHDSECYLLANDLDQARDDFALARKLIQANPVLQDWLTIKRDIIERVDGRGFLKVLPAGDVVGQHGKSYRFVGYDEIHGYRSWDIFEAMQPDPHRSDSLQWITSYASLFHRPGVPLFDLIATGKAGTDPRMLFSWYAADFTTDPAFTDRTPEERANPSMASWNDPGYLAQQQRRLPSHKFRRLHLNLPGLPEGSAFAAESVMDAVARGTSVRLPESHLAYAAFVDMSGGSNDDAVLGIGHRDAAGRVVIDVLQNQGQSPPFDPNLTVERFARTAYPYRIASVIGDRYAGETFKRQFEARGIKYMVCERTKSELYEAMEPSLNSRNVVLLDVPTLEQQLLGLVWRGGRIDHPSGEHDDFANAAAGVLHALTAPAKKKGAACITVADLDAMRARRW